MLRASSAFIVITAVMVIAGAASATVWLVPETFQRIQSAIGFEEVHDGDTISVWVPDEPPYTYHENISYLGKSLFVVNRSFLPDGGTGYDSSWNHVIIDGSNQIGSVVTMTGSAPAVPRVVLFRLTGEAEGLESPCADRKESVNGRTLAGPEPRPCPPKGSRRELADSGR